MKWMRRLAVQLLVCAPFALVAPLSSAQTTPSLTVTPNTGLVGGQVVTLAGTGFLANQTVYFCEGIVAEPLTSANCGTQVGTLMADGTGAFSVQFGVFRFITPGNTGNTTIDCAQPTAHCGFGAANITDSGLVGANAAISFTSQPPTNTFAIKGSVTGPDGHSVANANVWAYTSSDTWVGSLATVADANGAYELDSTINPHVFYKLLFLRPAGTDLVNEWFDDQTHRRSAQVLSLPRAFNDPVVTANAQLAAGGAITGVVTEIAGAGVSGVQAWAYGPGDRWVGSFGTTTAGDGTYRLDGVRPADYRVRFMPRSTSGLAIEWYDNAARAADAKSVTVTEGSTAAGIDAQLSP